MSYLFPIANNTETGVVSAGTNITIVNGVVSATGGGSATIGTWTPTISVATAGTVILITATANYAKMGQQVICYFDITVATKAGGANANTLVLNGLPFTSTAGNGFVGSLVVTYFNGLNSDNTYITGTVVGSSTSVLLWTVHQARLMESLTYQDIQVTSRFVGTITYISAS